MKIRNLALVLGAAFTVAAGGFAATACSSSSSDNNGGGTGTHSDSGTNNNNDSGGNTGNDSGSTTGDDAGTTTGPDCGTTPKLHMDTPGNIFCGYGAADGGALNCATGQECCLGGSLGGGMYQPEECSTWGGACPNNGTDSGAGLAIPIECNQNADCDSNGKTGNVCCLVGSSDATVAGCGFPKQKSGSIIQCEAPTSGTCAAGEVQICSGPNDCPSGKTCVAGKWKLFQVGFCQ